MSASPRRVLVVDDDPDLLRLLAIRLRREGYEVETAGGGRQALGILASFRPQLLVTDLRMGMEPDYVFRFKVAEASEGRIRPAESRRVHSLPRLDQLRWVWQRIWARDAHAFMRFSRSPD